LVDMYAKCGSTNLERVQQDAIRFNVVSWNAKLRGCGKEALK
jgi:hypothetical protein